MSTFDRSIKHYVILLLVPVIILVIMLCFQGCSNAISITNIIVDILVGFISALILLILIELNNKRRDRADYGYLEGKYKREIRGNEQPNPDARWRPVITADDPNIEMKYKGNRKYEIPSINYDEKWYAKASIFLDATNRKYGSGVYQYHIKSETLLEDFGKFELFVDELDNKKIYIFHQNYLPSGRSAGYEIFVKQ
jgi:hypothetical protein